MNEATLNINSLGENEILDTQNAVAQHIYNLISMKKNTDPLNPDKGVDINSYRYAYDDSAVLANIDQLIRDQISMYTPYEPLNVIIDSVNGIIRIAVALVGVSNVIAIQSDGQNSSVNILKNI